MRARLASLLAILLTPAAASAHSLDFGVLRITETTDGAVMVLRAAGHEGTPPDVGFATEGGCALVEPPSRAARGDRLEVRGRCRGSLEGTTVAVEGMSEALTLAVVLERADGTERSATLDLARPRFTISGEPEPSPIFARYLGLGVEHLALGFDHLLFLLALVLVVLRARADAPVRALVWTATGFTLGHSLTLSLQVLGVVSLPSAPAEACIALSIVLLAAELARPPRWTWTMSHPAAMSTIFGLLHGLGFAGALGALGWPPSQTPTALAAFNLGLEIAQLAVVALAFPLAASIVRARAERMPAYAIGAIASFWTLSRLGDLIV